MLGSEFLRTRVAARVLTLFVVGAIVPVLVLAALSFRAVSSQLAEQSEERLLQVADATVQIILERLSSAQSWAQSAGQLALSATGGRDPVSGSGPATLARLAAPVRGLAVEVGEDLVAVAGTVEAPPPLTDVEVARLRGGESVLKTTLSMDGVSLHLAMPAGEQDDRILWTGLSPDSVWAPVLLLASTPSIDDLCILSTESELLVCKRGPSSQLPAQLAPAPGRDGVTGIVRFGSIGERRIAGWKSVYLRSAYGAPEWVVIVSETESSVYAPVASFAYNLPLSLSVALGLVLLLANVLVRRTMEPLVKLTTGTERIGRHDLTARVDVESRDEFGALASSFNRMADRLSVQFRALEAAQEIDRAVIEESNITAAVTALIDGIVDLLPAQRSAVLLFDVASEGLRALLYRDGQRPGLTLLPVEIDAADLPWLDYAGTEVRADPGIAHAHFSPAGIGTGNGAVVLCPMVVQGTVVGVVAIEAEVGVDFTDVDLRRANQLVDKAAVALNEVRLRRELVELTWDTLRALANAIDAKSRWTGGHSERVTELAGAIARELRITPADSETLHRGGLLHDIGKIGVSTEILNFPGRLDDEMRAAVETHPAIGAKILEPIGAFHPLIPIVRHHHERWDGHGYPDGLSGTAIPYLARILAVADVFDAMISARPYRDALPRDVVVAHVCAGAGSAFDPDMVAAFETVLAAGWEHEPLVKGGLTHVE